MVNPFHDIKSTNLDDDAIVDFWVDIRNTKTHQDSFLKLLAPESATPMFLLGGKGTGKTHILRFYSYRAQKSRAIKKNKSPIEQIRNENFISVYVELGNFGFERFKGAQISQTIWNEWYFYYINLLFIDLYLDIISDLTSSDNFPDSELDSNFHDEISRVCFKDWSSNKNLTLKEAIKEISVLISRNRIELNQTISKIQTGITKDFSGMDLLFDTRENVFFDIVHTIQSSIPSLDGVRVLFLIDQFEDLSKSQQIFINTLLRHPKFPKTISLRISGRLYAKKTKDTYSDDQKLLESEAPTK